LCGAAGLELQNATTAKEIKTRKIFFKTICVKNEDETPSVVTLAGDFRENWIHGDPVLGTAGKSQFACGIVPRRQFIVRDSRALRWQEAGGS